MRHYIITATSDDGQRFKMLFPVYKVHGAIHCMQQLQAMGATRFHIKLISVN